MENLSSQRKPCQIKGPYKNKFSWTVKEVFQLSLNENQSKSVILWVKLFISKIVTTFLKCGILFKNDLVYILVIPLNSFHRETCDTFEHECFTVEEEGLEKTLKTKKNFLIYPKSDYEFLVFSNESKNNDLFRRLDHSITSTRKLIRMIKFEDVIKAPKAEEKQNEKKNRDFSLNHRKLCTKRLKALPPLLHDVYEVSAFPSTQNGYPTQVSDEQNIPETTEFAFSGNSLVYPLNESIVLTSSQGSLRLDSAPSLNEHRTVSRPARYRDYISFSARLDSFRNWTTEHQNPDNLSRAGFFYTGEFSLVFHVFHQIVLLLL